MDQAINEFLTQRCEKRKKYNNLSFHYEDLISSDNAKFFFYKDENGNELEFCFSDGHGILTYCVETKTSTIITPEKVMDENGHLHNIDIIGRNAFLSKTQLKKVIFSEGIKYMFGPIFPYCNSLEEVTFPSTLKQIKDVFWNCPLFEENKGILYYTGTPEKWAELVKPLTYTVDHTNFQKIIRFK